MYTYCGSLTHTRSEDLGELFKTQLKQLIYRVMIDFLYVRVYLQNSLKIIMIIIQ